MLSEKTERDRVLRDLEHDRDRRRNSDKREARHTVARLSRHSAGLPRSVYAGSRLKPANAWEGAALLPAFQPYRGKPAVRNDRERRGNVGIIRSPIRASTLPTERGWETERCRMA